MVLFRTRLDFIDSRGDLVDLEFNFKKPHSRAPALSLSTVRLAPRSGIVSRRSENLNVSCVKLHEGLGFKFGKGNNKITGPPGYNSQAVEDL